MATVVGGNVVVAMVADVVVVNGDVSLPIVCVSFLVDGHSEELLDTVPGTAQSNFAVIVHSNHEF